jgi:hypothetical protein
MNYSAPCRPRVQQYQLQSNCCTETSTDPAALALQVAALLPEKDTYQFFDAFGKEIKPTIYPNRASSPRG